MKSLVKSASTLAVAAVAVSVLAAPAEAAGLGKGSFSIRGNTFITDADGNLSNGFDLNFENFNIVDKTGALSGLAGIPTISSFSLTPDGDGGFSNGGATISGLSLGGKNLTFDFSGISLFGTVSDADNYGLVGSVSGLLKSPSQSISGKGGFGAFQIDENFLSANIAQVSVQTVPTPALLPGLLGLGVAALRKRNAKNDSAEADA